MRNASNKVAMKPITSRTPTDPTVYYKLAEGSGSTFSDALGNGADLTLAGYESGTPFASTGWITFDGTNHYLTSAPAATGTLETICDLREEFGAVLIGLDVFHDSDTTTGETLLSLGTNSAVAGVLTLTYNSAEVLQLTARGIGASGGSAAAYSGTGSDLSGSNGARANVLIVLRNKSGLTCNADLYTNGVYVNTMVLDFSVSGGTDFPWLSNGLFVGVSAVASGSPSSAKFGAGGATDSRLSRLFLQRHYTYDAARVAAIALGLKQYGYDLPPEVYR